MYRAQTPIRHDGVTYAEGDLLEIAEAGALLAAGAVVAVPQAELPPAEPAPAPAPKTTTTKAA